MSSRHQGLGGSSTVPDAGHNELVATAARRQRRGGGGGKKKLNPFAAKSAAPTAKEKYPIRAEDFLRGSAPAAAAAAAVTVTATAPLPSNPLAIPRGQRSRSSSSSNGWSAGVGSSLMAGLNERVSKRRRNSGSVDAGARTFEDDFDIGQAEGDDGPIDPVAAVFATPRKQPAADADADADADKPTRTRLPLDWSLKMHMKFTSAMPFDWSKKLKSAQSSVGVTNFVRKRVSRLDPDAESAVGELGTEEAQREFQRATMYYVHPSQPWSKPFADAVGKITSDRYHQAQYRGITTQLDSVNSDWNTAFASLFRSLQNGHCDYFYAVATEFTAFFRGPGTGGADDFSATLTNSTKGLRATLQREDIEFMVPLSPEYHEHQRERQEAQQRLAEVEKLQSGPHRITTKMSVAEETVVDGACSSMLTFDDYDGVTALFEFILNRKYTRAVSAQMQEPPTLYSNAEFLNCTLRQIKTKFCGPLTIVNKGARGGGRVVETKHALELEGPFLPEAIQRLCKLFSATQDGTFDVNVLRSAKGMGALNYCGDPEDEPEPGPGDAPTSFLKQRSELGTSVLHTLRYDGGGLAFTTKVTP